MVKLLVGILVIGLLFATAALADTRKDQCDRFGYIYGDTQGSYDGNFDQWDAAQQSRMEQGLEDGAFGTREYSELRQELSNLESFYNWALSKGRITPKDQGKLTEMEAQLSGNISIEMQKACTEPMR